MRKLLIGFLILAGLTGIASADYQPSAGWADSPTVQDSIARELVYVQREMALTPEQAAQVKAAMEASAHGTAIKPVVQMLHEVCTPAQFSTWKQMRLVFERKNAANMAAAETDQVEKTIFLSTEQRHEVEAAFYQIEMADRTFRYTAYTKAELEAHLAPIAVDRENALDKILTPAQIEKRTRIAAAGLTKPLPGLPTLSLAATFPANSYGWVSDSAAP